MYFEKKLGHHGQEINSLKTVTKKGFVRPVRRDGGGDVEERCSLRVLSSFLFLS